MKGIRLELSPIFNVVMMELARRRRWLSLHESQVKFSFNILLNSITFPFSVKLFSWSFKYFETCYASPMRIILF